MTLMQAATQQLFANLLAVSGRLVCYRRLNPADSYRLLATVGKTNHETDTEFGVMSKETKDFIFKNVFDFKPVVGDRIEDRIGEDINVYEVIAPNGTDCYNHPDPDNIFLRVHTQLIDVL